MAVSGWGDAVEGLWERLWGGWQQFTSPRKRKYRLLVGYLSLLGLVLPGGQRFYLGQMVAGWIYVGLGTVPLLLPGWGWLVWIPRGLSALEALWVLVLMDNADFENRFNRDLNRLEWRSLSGENTTDGERQLEEMRRAGIISEEEYQQRRQEQEERLRGKR